MSNRYQQQRLLRILKDYKDQFSADKRTAKEERIERAYVSMHISKKIHNARQHGLWKLIYVHKHVGSILSKLVSFNS